MRKIVCGVIVLCVALFALFIGTRKSRKPLEALQPIQIMFASDLHYISPRLTDHGSCFTQLTENSDGKVMKYSEELMDAFVYDVVKATPDVLILTGDLTFNGAVQSHEDLALKLQAIVDEGIPVLVIPGNHDLNNSNAAKFEGDGYTLVDGLSAERFSELYQAFGYGSALARDTASLSYVWEASPQLRLLFLDVNGVPTMNTVPAETLRWLKQQLQQAQQDGVRVLAFSHQNLLQHSVFSSGYVIENSQEVLSLYEEYSVIANFSGHLHIQHIGQSANGFNEVATSALSVTPNQYAQVQLSGNSLEYQTYPLDVSQWAQLQNSSNEELLNFQEYAEQFFYQTGFQQDMQKLADSSFSEEKKRKLAEYSGKINLAYFAGRMDTLEKQETLLAEWRSQGFHGAYLNTVFQEPAIDHNTLVIRFP